MISKEKACELYFKLLRIRLVEEEIAKKYGEQKMRCPVHLSVGQEATPVGICESLSFDDVMFSTHRAHAHYLAKSGNLEALIGELYGRVTGCSRGQGGSMHLIDLKCGFMGATSIVGGTVPVGVGAAFGFKMKKANRISVVAIGDTVVEEGVFHESANFAALKKLPVIFMCENNGYSCYSPLKNRQPNRPLKDVAFAHGIPSYQIDGNNVFDVFNQTSSLISDVRNGSGPIFLEFATFRFLEHCGPNNDDALEYRTSEEVDFWKTKDPILQAQQTLKQMNYWSDELDHQYRKSISHEIKVAFEHAVQAPYPSKEELGAYTYAE